MKKSEKYWASELTAEEFKILREKGTEPAFSGKYDQLYDKGDYVRIRTEITCAKCDGHMGHVFDDGPTSTGKRYCVNSVSIEFKKRE
jgi:peptide-methionine (R)-S-oxide reductase